MDRAFCMHRLASMKEKSQVLLSHKELYCHLMRQKKLELSALITSSLLLLLFC